MSKVKQMPVKTISEDEVRKLQLKGKPQCPFCRKPLNYLYEGAHGPISEKCGSCGNRFLIDAETLEVVWIQQVV